MRCAQLSDRNMCVCVCVCNIIGKKLTVTKLYWLCVYTILTEIPQSARAVEYTDCTSAEG